MTLTLEGLAVAGVILVLTIVLLWYCLTRIPLWGWVVVLVVLSGMGVSLTSMGSFMIESAWAYVGFLGQAMEASSTP